MFAARGGCMMPDRDEGRLYVLNRGGDGIARLGIAGDTGVRRADQPGLSVHEPVRDALLKLRLHRVDTVFNRQVSRGRRYGQSQHRTSNASQTETGTVRFRW
jgi:hypothetical protein